MKKITFLITLFITNSFFAQENLIELFRQDVKTKKMVIVSQTMNLSDTDAEKFWPIYRDYQYQKDKLNDKVFALIKDFAASYATLSDEKAEELMNMSIDLDEENLDLKRKYFKQMNKELSAKTVVKFFQIDNRVEMLVKLQISGEIPLVIDDKKMKKN